VITGSFNFTEATEEQNRENLLITEIKDCQMCILKNGRSKKEFKEMLPVIFDDIEVAA
jgi:phosphatidylserine/phosphatidylglycerophosphate/cardiolipin synthase-like enzyme